MPFAKRSWGSIHTLVRTANAIYDIESRSLDLSADQVADITAMACKTLERLLSDKQFLADLDRIAALVPDYREQLKRMESDLTYFMDSFVRPEATLLKNAGLSPSAISYTLASAGVVRDALRHVPEPKSILSAIERLRSEVCEAGQNVVKATEDERARSAMRSRIRDWMLSFLGLSMIAIDAASSAPSGGFAVASFTIGGAVLGVGLSGK